MKWMLATLALTAACNATPLPRAVSETAAVSPNVSFARYHTFSFGLSDPPQTGYAVTSRSLDVQRRLGTMVQTALEARGYVQEPGKGDFIVKLASGTWEPPSNSVERPAELPPARGFIGIDVYDATTGIEVWQGSAFAEIDPQKIDDTLLQRGVMHMLAQLPARAQNM
jgi:Domain of unknown function (DUF4136)